MWNNNLGNEICKLKGFFEWETTNLLTLYIGSFNELKFDEYGVDRGGKYE